MCCTEDGADETAFLTYVLSSCVCKYLCIDRRQRLRGLVIDHEYSEMCHDTKLRYLHTHTYVHIVNVHRTVCNEVCMYTYV